MRQSPAGPTLDLEQVATQLLLAPHLDPAQVRSWLEALGFEEAERVDRCLQRLAGPPPTREAFAAVAPELLRCLRDCPCPEGALHNLSRFVQQGDPLTTYHLWKDDPESLRWVVALMSSSQLLADILIRNPEYLSPLLEPETLDQEKGVETMIAELAHRIRPFRTLEAQKNVLRRYKRQEFLRLGARDILGRADLKTITRELSALAEAEIRVALECVERDLQARQGPPPAASAFAIIGMGKLGAQELNYNSDIDVLFVYRIKSRKGPEDSAACCSYYEQVARGVLQAVGEMTSEGRVFRVDARLRPEGEQGPLVRSLDSYINYYEAWAEPWESQALLKARPVAGDPDLGQRFNALAQEVAYGRQLDQAAINSIRANKRRLEERATWEGQSHTQVKQGYGGLRDVEFTVQLLQLVYGLTDPQVRVANTWEALEALARQGYLTESEREALEQSYIFLRRVEHQLQLQQEVPRQALPDKPSELRALAKRLGYFDGAWTSAAERFKDAYRWHTERVRALCEKLFFHPLPTGPSPLSAEIQLLLDPLVKHEEGAAPLQNRGFQNPAEARRRLVFLAYGEPPMRLPERVQQVFVEILPRLLHSVTATPDPDAAIRNFERFISAARGREMFYEFLRDQPRLIDLLSRLGGFSEPLSRTLIDHPEYLDTITDRSVMAAPKGRAAFSRELAQRLAPLSQPELKLADLRRYKRREMFRIGVRDLIHAADLATTMAEISDLAEACLQAALEICLSSLPAAALPSPAFRFAILGLGKLGGRELHYSSDLDLLFGHALPPGADEALRKEAYQAAEKLAESVLQAMGERTRHGMVFDMDARLRPFGQEGQLSRTVESYRDYYARQGEAWERLALTRARFVAGDPDLGQELAATLHQAAFQPGLSAADRAEIRRIKRRIETERRNVSPGSIDLKLDPGGILEIEFLVQVLQLEHGRNRPEICTPNTSEALLALGQAGLLPSGEAAFLREAYQRLRQLELRLQLVSERSSAVLEGDAKSLAAAARRLEYPGRSEAEKAARLKADYESILAGVRAVYARILEEALGGIS